MPFTPSDVSTIPETATSSFNSHGIRSASRGVVIEDRQALVSYCHPTPLIDG